MGFPGSLVVRNLTANAGYGGFDPLGWEDPLEEEMTAHSSILSAILWNTMDREAWQAAVRGFTKMSHDSVTEHADRQTDTHTYIYVMHVS